MQNPNFLTTGRMLASTGIVILLSLPKPGPWTAFFAAMLFSLAAISDYFDGYFARRFGMISNFGKIMDPVADKLLISCSLIMLTALGWIPGWFVCLIIGRELAVTGLRIVLADAGKDVSAGRLGKYKTGFQIAGIIPLLLHFPLLGINFHGIGMFFLTGALALTIWSGTDYFLKARHLLTA
ncbi:MAG: CDP-diacylglycerol--glycerol-3-phosphate 3-phosphatidyltransferase [Desulfobacterales bacterium]|nr:MAG: CDP-diacylglycerol--glycerol-3-phosphate 3-phosphatidyltransferase [Desulfobacterales bacterium]